MKTKILLILAMLAAFLFVTGSGTALASGKYRGDRYGYNRHPVVVYHVQPRVVYKYHSPSYGRILPHYGHPYRPAYVYRQPVIVKHAPVRPVWGVTIHLGY